MLYAKGKLDKQMQMVVICETFGWTYQQFLQQPTYFIDLILGKMKIDAHNAQEESRKIKKK